MCAAIARAEVAGKVMVKGCIGHPCSMEMAFPDKHSRYSSIWAVARYLWVRPAGLCAAAA